MLFSKKVTLVENQKMTVGEFNIKVDGAYENVKSFPLEVKKGKDIYVRIKSDIGVDVCIVDTKGIDASFSQQVTDKLIGPVEVKEKGTMALMLGVGYGSLAHIEIEAWME